MIMSPRHPARMPPIVLLAALLAGCGVDAPARVEAPADAEAGEVAFRFAGPRGAAVIVPVHVNGEGPFDFVLDTGATFTCVDAAVAERLSLPEQRAVGVGAGVRGTGRVRLLSLDSLRVGAAAAEGLTACELDLAHTEAVGVTAEGLLGLNFLREFRVTVDFVREVIVLESPVG
jgi:predicted aspartyl protease